MRLMCLTLVAVLTLSVAIAPQQAFAKDADSGNTGDSGGSESGGESGGGNSGGGNSGGGSSDNDDTPARTNTSSKCGDGMVWDWSGSACVSADASSLNNNQRFDAVEELAYVGRYESAKIVLAAMTEGDTNRVLAYQGFLLRKTGQVEAGIAVYEHALAIDPANILVRSYYGQLLVEMNEMELAQLQYDAILLHGGAGSWSERSLSSAIETGVTYSY